MTGYADDDKDPVMGHVPPCPPLPSAAFKDAQDGFMLSDEQFAALIGIEGAHQADRLAQIMDGTKTPNPAMSRLLTAYLEGYRPDDWPGPDEKVPEAGPMTGAALHDARIALELTRSQFTTLIGYEGRHSAGQLEDRLKSRKTITAPTVRLVRAYLDGYRPKDWPSV